MQEQPVDSSTGASQQIPVSPNNPCPFLRGLVAGGYVGGHVVPLRTLTGTIESATGEKGLKERLAGIEIYLVALIANGLSPLRLFKSWWWGPVLDELRDDVKVAVVALVMAMSCENAEVLPFWSVAVAESTQPAKSDVVKVVVKLALPEPSVVTLNVPRSTSPWPYPEGSAAGLVKSWTRYVLLAPAFNVPLTVVVPSEPGKNDAMVSTGKFCEPLGVPGMIPPL